jgi:hypothetical protein
MHYTNKIKKKKMYELVKLLLHVFRLYLDFIEYEFA